MLTNILQYLEGTVSWLPEKPAFRKDKACMTFRQLQETAGAIGSFLLNRGIRRQGIALMMDKGAEAAAAFFGIAAAGNYCIPLDEELPEAFLNRILTKADPALILCDRDSMVQLMDTVWKSRCVSIDKARSARITEAGLASVRAAQTDAEPVCALYPSGMDGEPRGILLTHRNLLDSTELLCRALKCGSDTVFGSIAPMSEMNSLREMMCTVKVGGTCCLLPGSAVQTPMRILEAINCRNVNTLLWPSSALAMFSGSQVLSQSAPKQLRCICFDREPIKARQLALWKKAAPNASFFRLYGPEEAGGACCCKEIGNALPGDGELSVGTPFPNIRILLLDETGREAQRGEICILGSCLSPGYHRDFQFTQRRFVQNPGNSCFPERIFRTGDYGMRNAQGELVVLGRQDGRISVLGRRIQPAEVERAVLNHPQISLACCQYEEKAGRLQLFYTGSCTCMQLAAYLKTQLPAYMIPKSLYRLDSMPMIPGGTVDRGTLRRNSRKGSYAYETVAEG